MTITDLAQTTNVDEGDLRVILVWHEHQGDDIPVELFNAVDAMVNPDHLRTVPELWMEGLSPGWRTED